MMKSNILLIGIFLFMIISASYVLSKDKNYNEQFFLQKYKISGISSSGPTPVTPSNGTIIEQMNCDGTCTTIIEMEYN